MSVTLDCTSVHTSSGMNGAACLFIAIICDQLVCSIFLYSIRSSSSRVCSRVMGCAGGVACPGVNVPMRRFDGAVAVGALCVVGAALLAFVLLWAKALLAVHGNINKMP